MGLHKNILSEPVSELELRQLMAVSPGTTCRQAVAFMRANRVGYVVIVDEAGRPLGMFTERMLVKLLVQDPALLDDPVENHMSGRAMRIGRNEPIAKVIEMMQTLAWRFLCVVDEQGRAVGVTGQRGIVEYIADLVPRQVKVQRMASEFFSDQREGA